ncbi:hypothetical protein MDOR_01530 [Mycolicibacterium doricum]|uniref:Very short patch repair endonuclease n=2 Tax=Mycolicibacterium doricum TaxID=126673 RepID=A0A7I7VL78_9MYCO|nr:very short patch repair endonuclease [Mycolicibacterium doricum]BBZ05984.1 hypothetical protein MDOR_01530 [Mycolicibacterium doricum]
MPETTSWASSPTSRKVMQGNRSRDTKPELAVRKLLHAMGLRYRVGIRPEPALRRTADIVFTRQRIAVFIDGCFWHGCVQHRPTPAKANSEYWSRKLAGNIQRDADTTARLESSGWRVMRFWEHDPPESVADQVIAAVRGHELSKAVPNRRSD